jgi:uncharacterized protein YoxC
MAKSQALLLENLSDRVETLALAMEGLRARSGVQIDQLQALIKDIQATIKELNLSSSKLAERVAALEQRCAALEKVADRSWQVWLAIIGAGVALFVAHLKR